MAIVKLVGIGAMIFRGDTDVMGQERHTRSLNGVVEVHRGFIYKPKTACLNTNPSVYLMLEHKRVRCMRYGQQDYIYPPRGGSVYDHVADEITRFKNRQLQQLHRPCHT